MKKIIIALVCIIVLLLSGCITEQKVVKEEKKPFIVYSTEKIPVDLMVLDRRSESELEFINALFEGLISMDKDGDITPALAEDWEVSEDKIEYRFTIRENARWSDGSEITANDFVSFFSDILSKKSNNIFYSQLSCIYGVEDYYNGKVKANELGIKAEDNKTLVIRLNYPNENLLKVLSMPIYTLRNDINKLTNWKMNYKNIKYSGAFIISNIDEESSVTIEKNTYYWNEDEVMDSKFLIVEKNNRESALAEYETSKIDIVANPPISEVKRLMESENTVVVNTSNKIGITFNFTEKSIGSDKNFRKALAEAIDPKVIAEKALSEYSIASNSNSEEAVNVFKNTAYAKYNSKIKAEEYLKHISESKLKSIKLIALNSDKNKKISNVLKETIDKQLKVSIKVNFLENYELIEAIKNREFDILLTNYLTDYDKEISTLAKFTTKSIDNYGKYSNYDYDAAFSKAKLEKDSLKKRSYLNECSDILKEDIPVIFLFNDVKLISKSPDLSGLDVNIFGNLDFRSIYRKK